MVWYGRLQLSEKWPNISYALCTPLDLPFKRCAAQNITIKVQSRHFSWSWLFRRRQKVSLSECTKLHIEIQKLSPFCDKE